VRYLSLALRCDEAEGAEYARIAENLRKGGGYVGLITPGPEVMFPPLYPLLISGVSFLTGSYEWAARIIALTLGSMLPLTAFGVASRLFNRRTAFVAAALTMLHPLLVSVSFTVFSEGLYATVLLFAVYLVLCALSLQTNRIWFFVGALFGLAFLLRQEAVAVFLIVEFFALVATNGNLVTRSKRAAAALVIFIAVVSPQIIYIHHVTGKLRLEAKSSINLPINILSDGGTPDSENRIAYGINSDLQGTGIWMRPQVDEVRDASVSLRNVAHLIKFVAPRNIKILLEYLSSRWMGGPFIPALALLGAFRRPWRRSRAAMFLFVALVPAAAFAATFTTYFSFPRYYFLILPFLLIWAANGLVEIGLWLKATTGPLMRRWHAPLRSEYIVPALIGILLVIYPLREVRATDFYFTAEGSPSNRVVKDVGLWIRQQQSGPIRIMARSAPFAFHADADLVWYPYCTEALALRFVDAANVDYLVLRRGENFSKYYEDWQTNGIPDARAELVFVSSGRDAGEVKVYRWHHPVKLVAPPSL